MSYRQIMFLDFYSLQNPVFCFVFFFQAEDGIRDIGVTGVPTCALPISPGATLVCRAAFTGVDPNCVPYNVFQLGAVTPEALEYLQTPGFQRGNVNETVANANLTLTGEEYGLQTPWSDRGVAVNVGAEYRKESLRTLVDEAF